MFAAIIIGIFIISVIYAHSRGVEKQKLSRQLFDHSTFMAPINMFMTRFSTLPAKQPYFDTTAFPELQKLTENWQVIREEALQLQHHIKAAQANNDAGFNTFFKRGWKRFYLKWYSDAHPSAETLCPITTKLVNSIPSIKAAMFAELPPGAYLGKHRDPYAGSVRYHLGLSTPNDDRCFKWRWAQSVNHWVGASLMSAASSPNDENDRTGAINRIFKYVHAARDAGQRLKKKNRTLYYALKYLVIAAIFAAIILFSLL